MQNTIRAERQFTRRFERALKCQISNSDAKAQQLYQKALRIQENASCYVNLGLIAQKRGNLDRAESLYRKAIALEPDSAMAHNNLGALLDERGDSAGAAEAFRAAAALQPMAITYANLADIYAKAERYAEAMAFIDKGMALDPNCPQLLANAAMIAWAQNQFEIAAATTRRAIACGADDKARVNLGLLLLTMGDYAEGWQEYAWRFSANKIMMRGPEEMPIWKGRQKVPGTLYVWPEQGLGDEILYAGAMHLAAERAEQVIWECEPRLAPLLARTAPANVSVVPMMAKPPQATAQIPAGCLMQMFHPTEPRRAYLKPDPERVEQIRRHLPRFKRVVGISWASGNKSFGHKKTLSLDDFAPFIENPDYHCISLQYGDHDHGPLHVLPGLDLMQDIDGVAAAISACDLVVTASNTVAHLAGALGVPTVVMVSAAGGKLWYWGTGDRTVWYESVRIQRFERAG